MPKSILYDPESRAMKPLAAQAAVGDLTVNKEIGGVVYAQQNQGLVRQCCGIIRDICRRRNIPEDMVPVVHRIMPRFRYVSVKQGKAGASNWCVLLCSEEWYIASKDEEKIENDRRNAARIAADEQAKNEASAKLVAEVGIKEIITAAASGKKIGVLPEVNTTPSVAPKSK